MTGSEPAHGLLRKRAYDRLHTRQVPQRRKRYAELVRRFEFVLRISPEEYLGFYRGEVSAVVAEASNGLTVQFPAALLRSFLTHAGVEGRFLLLCDDSNRCLELRRLGPR